MVLQKEKVTVKVLHIFFLFLPGKSVFWITIPSGTRNEMVKVKEVKPVTSLLVDKT